MPQLSPTPSATPSIRAKTTRRLLALPLLLLAAGISGCASHFDQVWKEASNPISATTTNSLLGKWEGRWQSNGFDYEDGLCRAVITPDDKISDSDAGAVGKHYRVDMKLFYFNLLPRDFSFILTAAPQHDEKTALLGEKDFGAITEGVWKFEGDLEGRSLFLSFVSAKDYGTMSMRRVPPVQP